MRNIFSIMRTPKENDAMRVLPEDFDLHDAHREYIEEKARRNVLTIARSIYETGTVDIKDTVTSASGELEPYSYIPKGMGKSMRDLRNLYFKSSGHVISDNQRVTTFSSPWGRAKHMAYTTQKKVVMSHYSYSNIDSFFKKESYFSRSTQRQIETILRNGYNIVCKDPKISADVRRVFTVMEMRTGMKLDQTISTAAHHLLTYGVLFIQKIRRGTRTNFIKIDNNNDDDLINSLRFMNMDGMRVYVDEYGNLSSVKEIETYYTPKMATQSGYKKREGTEGVPSSEIVYAVITHPGDRVFPDPPALQTLDDILTLRSIEETAELLSVQCSSPLLHATIDDDDRTVLDQEVRDVHNSIISMAPNGFITTRGKVKIEIKNLQAAMADLLPLIEHFKTRVLVGSGSSPVSVGESHTGNRSTVDSIDTALADHGMFVGAVIANMFTNNIIPDILLSLGYSPSEIIDESTGLPAVQFIFNDMQFDRYLSKINNALAQFNGNAITHAELRNIIGRYPMSDTEKEDLLYNLFPEKTANGQAKEIGTQNQPTNQYGTKSAPGSKKN